MGVVCKWVWFGRGRRRFQAGVAALRIYIATCFRKESSSETACSLSLLI